MNSPIDPRRSRVRLFAWPADLPPEPEVPMLDPAEGAEQADEDARFLDSFRRAEIGLGARDAWDSDG